MGIGHFVDFGYYDCTPAERMQALRGAGFDEVMLWWGDEHTVTQGRPLEQFDLAQRYGLRVRTAHHPFGLTNALWLDNLDGQSHVQMIEQGLETAGKLGIEHLVLHTNKGKNPPEPNHLGLARMRRLVEKAARHGVVLALENTRFLRHQAFLFDAIASPFLGFCYDSGHAHCFTPAEDPLALFGRRLVTTHLSDNRGPGQGDLHLRPGLGTIDFAFLVPRLLAFGPKVSLNLESARSEEAADRRLCLEDWLEASQKALSGCIPR